MPFVTIDGVAYDVIATGAEQLETEWAGEDVRAFDQSMRSSKRNPKRGWKFPLYPLGKAAFEALENKILTGNFYNVGGDAMPTASNPTMCAITLTGQTFVQDGTDFVRGVVVTARAV